MSSSASLHDDFGNSTGWDNYTRLTMLVFSGGTRVIRELFDSFFPPETLTSTLDSPRIRRTLMDMKRRRLISSYEWKLLYPRSSGRVSSKSWDISLLFILLRSLGVLSTPVTGWDELPSIHDSSLSANVVRLMYCSNAIFAHPAHFEDESFKRLWEEIKNAMLMIVSHYAPDSVEAWEKAIDELRVVPLADGDGVHKMNQILQKERERRARVERESAGERSGPGAEDDNGTGKEPIEVVEAKAAKAEEEVEAAAATTTPSEILASSPEALEAYKEALIRGKTKNRRVLITVVGPARAGKTSLLKSLKGEDFDQEEDSTDGLVLQKVFCKPQEDSWCEEDNSNDDLSNQCIVEFIAQQLENNKSREGNSDLGVVVKGHPNQKDLDNECEVGESKEDTSLQRSIFNEISQVPKEMQNLLEKHIKDTKIADQKTNEIEISLKTLDFAGQQVYEVILPLFISSKSIYILVYSLENDLHSDARPKMKLGNSERELENPFEMTNLDTQEFWLSCISSYTKMESAYVDSRSRVALPPVFVVCTHADVCENPKKVARELCMALTHPEKPYREHVLPEVYTVDNTLSGNREVKDESAKRLKKDVEELAKLLPQVNEDIPVSWLRFEEELSKLVEDKQKKYIDLEEARSIATNCNVDTATESIEFTTMLNYLHDLTTIIYFEETRTVFIDTQWLVNMFVKVITVLPFEDWKDYAEHWRELENKGILQRALVDHVWSDIASKGQDTVDSLLLIMKKFSLICPWTLDDEKEVYVVPCMLNNSKVSEDVEDLLGDKKSSTMVIRFKSVHLPMGIFPRLVVALAEHGKKEWPKVSLPKLRPNFCRMYNVGRQGVLDICIFSGIQTIFVTVFNKNNIDDLSVTTFCQSMRKLLDQIFITMHGTRPRVENMELEYGIRCPVCTKPEMKCRSHKRMGCKRCVHFVGEEELKLDRPECHEDDTNPETLIREETYSKWFPKTDIRFQVPNETRHAETNNNGNEAYSGNSGCLELVASISTQNLANMDCNEIAVKLAEYLQLDRLSMADPPADIQEKCRSFCQELKRYGRRDAITEIRKELPSGMTGPLLDGNMLFKELDFKTKRDLTRAMCGTDDLWKCVASQLQVSADHFGFFERQTNPTRAMLEDESNSGLKVGELYNILVQCEAAALADKYL